MSGRVAFAIGYLVTLTKGSDEWKFLKEYPRHQVVEMLTEGQTILIDGKPDENAWARTNWTEYQWVDITRHNDSSLNRVFPPFNLLRLKTLWSEHTLYIAAQLREPFVYGTVVGHNAPTPPYKDGDFEVFIDVSGSTQYYKEFEMNANNATYDVMWGVPDGAGLNCSRSGQHPYLPTCVNTSFPGYDGSWTMAGTAGGLRTSTSYNKDKYARYNTDQASAFWSAEIAFPIRPGVGHGGLLDAGSEAESARYRDEFDPWTAVARGERMYWWADFARAEHPRRYQLKDQRHTYCPPNCSDSLVDAVPSLVNPDQSQCAEVLRSSPTLLGVMPWNCYYEWVWQDLGFHSYMHRPLHWGVLEFRGARASNTTSPPCLNAHWPGRLLATHIFYAQAQYKSDTGTFAPNMSALATRCTRPRCDPSVLSTALALPHVFGFTLRVRTHPRVLDSECSARPCYTATVTVSVPATPGGGDGERGVGAVESGGENASVYVYSVSVDQNMRMLTDVRTNVTEAPCL